MEIRCAKMRSQRCLETSGTSGTALHARRTKTSNRIAVKAEKIIHERLGLKKYPEVLKALRLYKGWSSVSPAGFRDRACSK